MHYLIDYLLVYLKNLYKEQDFNTLLDVVDYILMIDDLNAQALHYQLNTLTRQGGGNKAVFLFEKFCDKYKMAHSGPYPYDLKAFLRMDVDSLWEK